MLFCQNFWKGTKHGAEVISMDQINRMIRAIMRAYRSVILVGI
jgi:hypothetical protein